MFHRSEEALPYITKSDEAYSQFSFYKHDIYISVELGQVYVEISVENFLFFENVFQTGLLRWMELAGPVTSDFWRGLTFSTVENIKYYVIFVQQEKLSCEYYSSLCIIS